MNAWLVVAILVLVFLIIIQIARAVELASLIRGSEEKTSHDNSKLHGNLMLLFLIIGGAALVWSLVHFSGRFLGPASSEHGPIIDRQFNITLILTGIVFVITQIALFWFSYRYREKEGRKALFFPDHNKLEIAWTIVPAIVMTFLVVRGMGTWYEITGDAPSDAVNIEVTARQFGWDIRYPGKDGKFGAKGPLSSMPTKDNPDKNNILGLDWNDPASRDDIITKKLVLPADKPVHVRLRALDVLHSFFLPQLRVKMDVVPGTPTRFWFTPTETTEEMIAKEGKDFKWIFTCAELCGKSHFSMAAAMDVITIDSFNTWATTEKPYYELMYIGATGQTTVAEPSLAQNGNP